ncbi:hypothetical protein JCM10599A_03360 [Paraburkholderia kururiensis]
MAQRGADALGTRVWKGGKPTAGEMHTQQSGALLWLLHCTKFDLERVGTNPNAKKYRSGVSFRVAPRAPGDYLFA